jgi:hypothetical protein
VSGPGALTAHRIEGEHVLGARCTVDDLATLLALRHIATHNDAVDGQPPALLRPDHAPSIIAGPSCSRREHFQRDRAVRSLDIAEPLASQTPTAPRGITKHAAGAEVDRVRRAAMSVECGYDAWALNSSIASAGTWAMPSIMT